MAEFKPLVFMGISIVLILVVIKLIMRRDQTISLSFIPSSFYHQKSRTILQGISYLIVIALFPFLSFKLFALLVIAATGLVWRSKGNLDA